MEIATEGGSLIGQVKSLRTYDLTLAVITIAMGLFVIQDTMFRDTMAWFTDAEECGLYILAKYSDGLKPHKHTWDLSIGSMVWPAYTVRCLVPGCQAELTVPHPWRKANDDKE